MEGAEYLIEIDLPPTATDVSADGLLGLPAKDKAAQLSSVAEIRMDLVMNRVYTEGLFQDRRDRPEDGAEPYVAYASRRAASTVVSMSGEPLSSTEDSPNVDRDVDAARLEAHATTSN
jgi:hypothetical protein